MRIHHFFHTAIAIACVLLMQLGCDGKCDPAVAAGHPHSCANPNAADGTEQGKCRNDSPPCDDHLRCIDNVCIPCGELCQTCCQPGLHFECDNGITCDNTHEPICTVDCGMQGLPCCDGTCPGTGSCDFSSGTCQGAE